ncbi:hypothetical protein [Pseudomonas fulva]|nr:hypothetical protein [Pseudomonas fulva]
MNEIVAALQALMTGQSLSFAQSWACMRTLNAWFSSFALSAIVYR